MSTCQVLTAWVVGIVVCYFATAFLRGRSSLQNFPTIDAIFITVLAIALWPVTLVSAALVAFAYGLYVFHGLVGKATSSVYGYAKNWNTFRKIEEGSDDV